MNLRENELLEELLNTQRKTLRYARLACLSVAVTLLLALAILLRVVPVAVRTFSRTESALNKVEGIASSVSTLTGENGALISDVMDKLQSMDTAKVQKALEKVEGLDLDSLNNVINSLQNVDMKRLNSAMGALDNVDLTRLNEMLTKLDEMMPAIQRLAQFAQMFGGGTTSGTGSASGTASTGGTGGGTN